MVIMNVTITLTIEVEASDSDGAEEVLRQTDDAELWAIAKQITYEYDPVE